MTEDTKAILKEVSELASKVSALDATVAAYSEESHRRFQGLEDETYGTQSKAGLRNIAGVHQQRLVMVEKATAACVFATVLLVIVGLVVLGIGT